MNCSLIYPHMRVLGYEAKQQKDYKVLRDNTCTDLFGKLYSHDANLDG